MPRINSREFNGETRVQVKERLAAWGLWGRFWRERERLAKERGDTNGNEAMMLLVLEPPYRKDMTADELMEHGVAPEKVEAWFAFKENVESAAPLEATVPEKKRGPGRPKGSKNTPKPTTAKAEQVAEQAEVMDTLMPDTIAAAKEGTTYQQGSYVEPPAEKGSRGKPWKGEMTKAEIARKAKTTVRRSMDWVFENIDVTDVTKEDAPSAGAWALLKWVRRSPANQSDFYKNFSAKMLPSRQQLDHEERKTDDGSDLTRTIAHLQGVSDAIQSHGSQALQAEPGVSA